MTVDMQTGTPCVEFLDDIKSWKEHYSISSILLAIQVSKPKYGFVLSLLFLNDNEEEGEMKETNF